VVGGGLGGVLYVWFGRWVFGVWLFRVGVEVWLCVVLGGVFLGVVRGGWWKTRKKTVEKISKDHRCCILGAGRYVNAWTLRAVGESLKFTRNEGRGPGGT